MPPPKDFYPPDKHGEKDPLVHVLLEVVDAVRQQTEATKAQTSWLQAHLSAVTLEDLKEMENRLTMKLADVKTAVAQAAKQNKEAFAEIGTKIADMQKQIEDLIADATDPDITDEAFLADLKSLGTDAQALADIVPGTPTAPPTE